MVTTRKNKIYIGKGAITEHHTVAREEAHMNYFRFQHKAEWGSVLANEIPIYEYDIQREEANDKRGSRNIGCDGMSEGDEIIINYIPFEKILIGTCETVNIKITDLSLIKQHEWEKNLNMLFDSVEPGDASMRFDLRFENFKSMVNYSDYFLDNNKIPILIVNSLASESPQKWFFCGLVLETKKRTNEIFMTLKPRKVVNKTHFEFGCVTKYFLNCMESERHEFGNAFV